MVTDPAGRRTWWPLLVAAALTFVGLRFAWGEPRLLTAAEADTLDAGIALATALTDDAPPPGVDPADHGLAARLKLGFATVPTHPRLDDFPADQAHRRAMLEPPVPRWLAALGIGLLPATEDTANGVRAGNAAALALAVAVLVLVAARRRTWGAGAWLAPGLLLLMPGVLDAGVSAGYGAAAILVMALLVAAVERLVATSRGALVVGLLLGLAFGIHPMALGLALPIFLAWAIGRAPEPSEARDPDGGALRLPLAPATLFAVPIVALVVLVAIWPTLWNETGKRLGAWLVDFGWYFNTPVEVAGQLYNQHVDRAAPAWTALVQWVAWLPLPVLGLWLVGVGRALFEGRRGSWFPILAWLVLLLCGAMDGTLFGSRWSLLALMWVPTAMTAADGARAVIAFARERLPRVPSPAIVAALLVVPAWQALTVSTWGAASQTGSDLTFALPLGVIDTVVEAEPGGIVAVVDGPAQEYAPQLDAARTHFDKDFRPGEPRQARWALAVGWNAEARERTHGDAVVVDRRAGVPITLWHREP